MKSREEIEALALDKYPDPKQDSHWERERVRFLRMGFVNGYKLAQQNNEKRK